jgi:hypothetical protein
LCVSAIYFCGRRMRAPRRSLENRTGCNSRCSVSGSGSVFQPYCSAQARSPFQSAPGSKLRSTGRRKALTAFSVYRHRARSGQPFSTYAASAFRQSGASSIQSCIVVITRSLCPGTNSRRLREPVGIERVVGKHDSPVGGALSGDCRVQGETPTAVFRMRTESARAPWRVPYGHGALERIATAMAALGHTSRRRRRLCR